MGLSSSFLGVQQGTVMTVPPSASDGFTPPLPSEAYVFWINETSPDPGLTFDLDFRVDAVPVREVPLPATAWLLGARR